MKGGRALMRTTVHSDMDVHRGGRSGVHTGVGLPSTGDYDTQPVTERLKHFFRFVTR